MPLTCCQEWPQDPTLPPVRGPTAPLVQRPSSCPCERSWASEFGVIHLRADRCESRKSRIHRRNPGIVPFVPNPSGPRRATASGAPAMVVDIQEPPDSGTPSAEFVTCPEDRHGSVQMGRPQIILFDASEE